MYIQGSISILSRAGLRDVKLRKSCKGCITLAAQLRKDLKELYFIVCSQYSSRITYFGRI